VLAHMHPFFIWLSSQVSPNFEMRYTPALRLDTHLEPPSAQSPFAQSECYPAGVVPKALLEGHYSFVIAHMDSCAKPPPS